MGSHSALDYHWVIICAFLVFMMQLGFAMLETGCAQSKNTINVAMKNLALTRTLRFLLLLADRLRPDVSVPTRAGCSARICFMIDAQRPLRRQLFLLPGDVRHHGSDHCFRGGSRTDEVQQLRPDGHCRHGGHLPDLRSLGLGRRRLAQSDGVCRFCRIDGGSFDRCLDRPGRSYCPWSPPRPLQTGQTASLLAEQSQHHCVFGCSDSLVRLVRLQRRQPVVLRARGLIDIDQHPYFWRGRRNQRLPDLPAHLR